MSASAVIAAKMMADNPEDAPREDGGGLTPILVILFIAALIVCMIYSK